MRDVLLGILIGAAGAAALTRRRKLKHRGGGDWYPGKNPPVDGASIDSELGRTVLLWAVALKLNRDEEGLRQLFELYGPGMRASPLAATFDYIAKPSEGAGFDLGSIQKQIADVDQFQAFMKNYRERLLQSDDSSGQQTGEQSAQTTSG